MFSAREDNGYFVKRAKEKGFIYRNQLALIKDNPLPSFCKNNFRSAFELCLYMTKGKQKTFNFISQNECVNVHYYLIGRKDTSHPTEKPLDFIKKLIKISSNKDDIVLDAFMGSGTVAIASKQLGRYYIGFEKCEEYYQICEKRLKECVEEIAIKQEILDL